MNIIKLVYHNMKKGKNRSKMKPQPAIVNGIIYKQSFIKEKLKLFGTDEGKHQQSILLNQYRHNPCLLFLSFFLYCLA